jgi:hypothetical protein
VARDTQQKGDTSTSSVLGVVLACPMSNEADRFRKQANEAREQAAKSISPLDKEAWLRVAEERLKLAVSIEGRRE